MENNQSTKEATREGSNKIPSQQGLYSKIAAHSDEILTALFELLKSRNENIRLGAAKILANKIIPDKKSVEVGGIDGQPIKFNLIFGDGYIPPNLKSDASPEGSTSTGQPPVQDDSLASESKKDDNGNNGTGEAVTG